MLFLIIKFNRISYLRIPTSFIMKKLFTIFFFSLCIHSFSQTSIPAGNVSGTWNLAGSPYQIQGSIQIPDGQTLTIDPGVTVDFQGTYKLNVQGRLLAIG